MSPADERARSPEQERRLIGELVASTQRDPTRHEERLHRRKVNVLVELDMVGPVTDEELEARVQAAMVGVRGAVGCKAEVVL